MAITIELTPEQEASIADARGLSVQQVVGQMLAAQLSATSRNTTLHTMAHPADHDDEQHRLHDILRPLFDRSDALERRPGITLTEPSKARIHESIREKYRAQGLEV